MNIRLPPSSPPSTGLLVTATVPGIFTYARDYTQDSLFIR